MENIDYIYIIGQVLGYVAVVVGFFAFQMRSAKKLLVMQSLVCVILCTHYIMIGAMPAFALNAVAIVRNIVYYNRDKGPLARLSKMYPVIFAVIMVVMGTFSWDGARSLLVIGGMGINTLCMALKKSQNIRKSVLVTSPMVLIYDIFVNSKGGIIFESMMIVSSVVGLIRNRGGSDGK